MRRIVDAAVTALATMGAGHIGVAIFLREMPFTYDTPAAAKAAIYAIGLFVLLDRVIRNVSPEEERS